jgi:hypothetical protein
LDTLKMCYGAILAKIWLFGQVALKVAKMGESRWMHATVAPMCNVLTCVTRVLPSPAMVESKRLIVVFRKVAFSW